MSFQKSRFVSLLQRQTLTGHAGGLYDQCACIPATCTKSRFCSTGLISIYIYHISLWLYIYILYPYLALHYIAFTFRCITWHCITFTLHIFCGLQICPHTCSKTPSKMILRDLIQKPNLQPTYIPCMTVQLPMTEGRIVAITWICLERFCWSLGVSYPLFLQMEMDGNGRCIHGRTFFHGFNLGRCLDLLRQLLLKCLAASRDMLFWSFLLLTFVQCVAGMSPGGFCTGNFGS